MSYKKENIVLIVEDDIQAAGALEIMLAERQEFKVAGVAYDALDALKKIQTLKPDILMLDIELPGKNAFELLEDLARQHIKPAIIFTTGHDEYVLKAIKQAAFDYLLKPIDKRELHQTLDRFLTEHPINKTDSGPTSLLKELTSPQKVCFHTRTGIFFIDPVDILYVEADLNYSILHFSGKKQLMVSYNLRKTLEMLPQDRFMRISRSYAVNKRYLDKILINKKLCYLRKDEEEIGLKMSGVSINKIKD